jgi:extracellular factor (EF) 3-hydroxypalmitic acid methyl ester biosynthesis protein
MLHYGDEMSLVQNGNGHSSNGHSHHAPKKAAPPAPAPGVKESQVMFETTEGVKLRGELDRMTRHSVVFELYNPNATPRYSEALKEFRIILQEREIYSGRAVVRNLVDAGNKIVCEATLNDADWKDFDIDLLAQRDRQIGNEFKNFLREWQKLYKVLPEFKVVVADMQTFLHDLRLWLERIELGIRAFAQPLRGELEKEAISNLINPVSQSIDIFIDRFESIVSQLEDGLHPAHSIYLRRQLHPFILASPFARRAFNKPLGYAGDYEMVDMMLRSPHEGDTLFAKIINIWLLGQSPAQAHRNRVAYLERKLVEETMRAKTNGRVCKIFNLGCGPADEVWNFFEKQSSICENTNLTLVDFNEETLQTLRKKLSSINRTLPETPSFRLLKKSVFQILKDGGKSLLSSPGEKYDYIYCAGLFDYLSDTVCKQLLNVFYGMLAPEGLLLVTNATDVLNSSRPFRYSMEYLLDWHLIYRDKKQFADVGPDVEDKDDIKVIAENTGANLFLEVRKPKNV